MKKVLIILLIGITNSVFSQSSKEIDSISNIMCEYLKDVEIKKITNRKEVLYKKISLYEKHLFPYLEKFEKLKAKNIEQKINYRLQRNCSEFRYLSNKIENREKNFSEINEKSNSTISEKELKEFKNKNKFYYFESAKDTIKVKVVMQNGKWEISFSDKTFCKMEYKWINEKKYELVFIESNNKFMSEYSVKGDKYIHQVLSKENGFYYININTEGQNTFTKFKMYYE
jgi:hypothetical protein